MAALMPDEEFAYCAISNIPKEFHSVQLRNFFSQFLEVGGFDCFHFKHRPERKIAGLSSVNELDGSSSLTTSVTSTMSTMSTAGGGRRKKKEKKEQFTTTCCVVRLLESNMTKLTEMYGMKNWVDSKGSMMPQLCHICRVEVITDDVDCDSQEPGAPFARGGHLEATSIGGSMLRSEILKLPELNPPDIMPNGNVGTPTSVYSQLIRECRLPPKVIPRLGIIFPKSRTNKRYGNVALDYGGEVLPVKEKEKDHPVRTAKGHNIYPKGHRQMSGPGESKAASQKLKFKSGQKAHMVSPPASEGEDSGEEWDRHEALHNDVTNQERTTERLFENEMEVTWDKGSSGLVFYTDAAFWDKQEGDFDEKTADDWDVDMSVYTDANGGDKDARDFIQMRRQQRMLRGLDCSSVFETKTKKQPWQEWNQEKERQRKAKEQQAQEEVPLGDFEKHTKGFGRKIMEAQGWVEGKGLGKSVKGIAQALHNDGQNSYDKRGFGYLGKKLSQKQQKTWKKKQQRQHSAERQVIISTVYDDPKVNDPDEPLFRSLGPYHLKYRDEVLFTKASGTTNS